MRQRALALAFACGASVAASTAAEPWIEVRSPSFTVATDGSEKDGRRVALEFERMRALLAREWPWARLDPARPLVVLALRNAARVPHLAAAQSPIEGSGLFRVGRDRNWIVSGLGTSRAPDALESPHRVALHEYVHLVLALNFGPLPPWLAEGLADYWGNSGISDDRVDIGRPVPAYVQILRQRPRMPLERLLTVTSADYGRADAAFIGPFQANAWAFVHYLALGAHEPAGQLNRLAHLLRAGRPANVAIADALGDTAALDRSLAEYAGRPTFRYRTKLLRLEIRSDGYAARKLRTAESLALRAGFAASTGDAGHGRSLASQAAALEPSLAAAHEALALVAFRGGQWKEARQYARIAARLAGASDYAHYLLGVASWREGGAEGLAEADASLQKAIEVTPSFADAFTALALVKAARKDSAEDALALAARAVALEPGAVRHRMTELLVKELAGRREDALAAARALRDESLGEDRREVESFLSRLEAEVDSAAERAGRTEDLERAFAAARAKAEVPPSCPAADEGVAVPVPEVERLTRVLEDGESAAKVQAAGRLGAARPPTRAIVEALAGRLSDRDEAVRRAVAGALDALGCAPGYDGVAGGLEAPPRPIRIGRPEYPQVALAGKKEGTVLVEILIGRRGEVLSARMLMSVPGLDEAALACVRSWLFSPAVRAGRLVPTTAQAPVVFRIQ